LREHLNNLDFTGSPAPFDGTVHVGRLFDEGGLFVFGRAIGLPAASADGTTRPAHFVGGKLLLFALLDIGEIRAHYSSGIPFPADLPTIHPQRLVTKPLDEAQRMRHQQNGFAAAFELAELVEAFVGEALVAHSQHFVHQQHIRIDVNGHGEAEGAYHIPDE
jgi:hypothetical protein